MIPDLAILLWSQENEIDITDNHKLWWDFLDYNNDCFWQLQDNFLYPDVLEMKEIGKRKYKGTYQLIDYVPWWW